MVLFGITTLGSIFFGTAEMGVGMWVTSWCLGAFSLVVGLTSKYINIELFKWLNLDLETVSDKDNIVTSAYARTKEVLDKQINHLQE